MNTLKGWYKMVQTIAIQLAVIVFIAVVLIVYLLFERGRDE